MSDTTTPVPFQHFPSAQSTFTPPLIANENAFLGDIATVPSTAPPLSAGFYRLEKGTPLEYTYTYDEMKIIVDGEFDIEDCATGEVKHVVKGDVLYFPNGSKVIFRTESFGLGFFAGNRVTGAI